MGKAAVGKSSLTIRYFHDKFNEEYNPTLQDTFTKKYNCKGQEGILGKDKNKNLFRDFRYCRIRGIHCDVAPLD